MTTGCNSRVIEHRAVWLIAAGGFAIRLLYAFWAQVEPWSDFAAFHKMALNILDGAGWHPSGRGLSNLAPAYPALVSLVFALQTELDCAWIANALLGGGTVVLGAKVAKRLWDCRVAVLGSAILIACHPDLVVYSGLIASENLGAPLLLCAVLLLMECRDRHYRACHR